MKAKHSFSANKPLNQVNSSQPSPLLLLILFIQNHALFSVTSAYLMKDVFSECSISLSIHFLEPQSHSFGTTPLNTSGQDRHPSSQHISF